MGKLNAMLTPLILMKDIAKSGLLLLMILNPLSGCDNGTGLSKAQSEAVKKQHAAAMQKCSDMWKDQPRVPIIGSDYVLDATRLPWGMDFGNWNKDEECGAANILGLFYWTGEKIIPASVGLTPYSRTLPPQPGWVGINFSGLVGEKPDLIRHCKAHPEDCIHPNIGWPNKWPPELVVRLKHYPDMEVRMYEKSYLDKLRPTDVVNSLNIFFREWPRDDGTPRSMFCDIGRNVINMTREEIENFDFDKYPTGSCQLEFWYFKFNGGSARVTFGTLRPQITTQLRALHQYLNESITKE